MENICPRRTVNALITDKRNLLVRVFVCFLIAALTLSLLCACDKDKDGDMYDKIFSSDTEEDKSLAFDKYILVLPSDCSADVYSATSALAEKIGTKTTATTELRYDRESRKLADGECEILIGKTSRSESTDYLKSFKINDFGYAYREGAILIGGISDSAVLAAIDKFSSDVLVYADEEILMNHDATLFVAGEYDVKKVILCGFELWDYSIIYPKDDVLSRLGAYRLRDAIVEKSGYFLEVKAENESDDKERAIRIGDTSLRGEVSCTETEYKMIPRPCGVSLVYGSNYGRDSVIDSLIDGLLITDENGCAELEISSELHFSISSLNTSMLNVCPLKSTMTLEDIVSIVNYVRDAAPAIIRVCGATDTAIEYVAANFVNDYSVVKGSGAEQGIYYICRNDSLVLGDTDTRAVNGVSVSSFTYETSIKGFTISVIAVSAENKTDTESATVAAQIVSEIIRDIGDSRVVIDSPFYGNAAISFESNIEGAEPIVDYDDSYAQIYGYLYRNGSYMSVGETSVDATDAAAYTKASVTLYK